MKHNFILFIFLIFCFCACNNSENTPELVATSSNISSVLKSQRTNFEVALLRPFSYNFEGVLEGQPLELFFSYNPQQQQETCIPTFGDYSIKEENAPNKLEGKICLDEGTVSLNTASNNKTRLLIEGKTDASLSSIQATWKEGNQTPRQLTFKNQNQKIPTEALKVFAEKLQAHFDKHPIFIMENIGVDNQGVFIKGFKSKGVSLEHFSSSRLKWSYLESSETASHDVVEIIDLWHYNNNKEFVIILKTIDWKENTTNNSDNESESINLEVWRLQNNKLENLFVKDPSKVDLSKVNWYAVLQNGVLQLHQNRPDMMWEWVY